MTAPKSTPAEAAADNLLAGLRPAFADLLSELRALTGSDRIWRARAARNEERFPYAPGLNPLIAILAKLEPPKPRQPRSPPKDYAPRKQGSAPEA
jgi:hypothetical protein